jgi:hypothetical protein
MFIFGPIAYPFIFLFKWLAELFRVISVGCFWLYSLLLGWSMWLNDATELNFWSRD